MANNFFTRLANGFRNSLKRKSVAKPNQEDLNSQTVIQVRKLGNFSDSKLTNSQNTRIAKSQSLPNLKELAKESNQVFLDKKKFDEFQNALRNTNLQSTSLINEPDATIQKNTFGSSALIAGNKNLIENFEKLKTQDSVSIDNGSFVPSIMTSINTAYSAIEGIIVNNSSLVNSDDKNTIISLASFSDVARQNIVKDIQNVSKYTAISDMPKICGLFKTLPNFEVKSIENGAIKNYGNSRNFYADKQTSFESINQIKIEGDKITS
jgi:hypothetical protein